jgi:hypothetical protein
MNRAGVISDKISLRLDSFLPKRIWIRLLPIVIVISAPPPTSNLYLPPKPTTHQENLEHSTQTTAHLAKAGFI